MQFRHGHSPAFLVSRAKTPVFTSVHKLLLQTQESLPPLSHVKRLHGLVVKSSASRAEDPGFESGFSGSSHTSDFKIGTPVATLPGAWRYRVSTGIGLPGVSIL